MAMRYFADCHFHVMTMKEPNFAAFINSLYSSPQELFSANATANYIITPKSLIGDSFINTISNTLTAFSRPIGDTIAMMEKDLMGGFFSERKKEYEPNLPYIIDGKLHFKGNIYDKMMMFPLVMDFSQNQSSFNKIYYDLPAEDKLTPYLEATVEGIKEYYKKNPNGLFEFYPFAGINPKMHSIEFLNDFLSKYINTTHKLHKAHNIPAKPFYGIKIYPPLDFNPWPKDEETLEKHRLLYSFCQKNRVPIITHCDDQGFRGINATLAWEYTDPATWRTVLENYPDLIIDFAHFGKQYAYSSNRDIRSLQAKAKGFPYSPWFRSIISLIDEFDYVYTDLSFTGTYPDFYSRLHSYIGSLSEERREKLMQRILFGSDFSVNLLKVESYTEYYSIFERSEFSQDDIDLFASRNPLSFIGFADDVETIEKSNIGLLE